MEDNQIQIDIPKELKYKFQKAAQLIGMDLQTVIRILMIKFIKGEFDINPPVDEIDPTKNSGLPKIRPLRPVE